MGRTVRRSAGDAGDAETWTCDWATQVGIPLRGGQPRPDAFARVRCTSAKREVVFTASVDWESWPDERLLAEIERHLPSVRG
jgi:hypothetical protein